MTNAALAARQKMGETRQEAWARRAFPCGPQGDHAALGARTEGGGCKTGAGRGWKGGALGEKRGNRKRRRGDEEDMNLSG